MLTVRTAWDQPYRPLHGDHAAALMIELEPGNKDRTLPVTVNILLDISGSMNEHRKLEKSKEACCHIIDQLGEQDHLSTTVFNHESTTIFANNAMTAENKRTAKNAVHKLHAQSVTLLDDALQTFLDSYTGKGNGADFLFLISDGRPTDKRGTPIKETVPYINQASALGKNGITMVTVALGDPQDYDAGFFNKLSETTGGAFRFSPNPGDLQKYIKEDLQVMQNTTVSDVYLEFKFNDPSTRLYWLGRAFPDKQFLESSLGNRYRLGHLASDQPQTFIAYIMTSAPFGTESGEYTIGQMFISSDNTGGQSIVRDIKLKYTESQEYLEFIDKGVRRWRIELDETSQTKKAIEARERGDQDGFNRHLKAAKRSRAELGKPTDVLNNLKSTYQSGDEERLAKILTEARYSRREE